jgi:isoquinoline 1-oxidoreductase beta subunit
MSTEPHYAHLLAGSSRRQFLKQLAGITFCCSLPLPNVSPCAATATDKGLPPPWSINAYVNIAADGVVTIFSPAAEMGQGTLTSLPLIVAEELDADWDKCRVEPSPPVGKVYGDPLFLGMIFTVSSRSVPVYYDRLRIFGAQARRILIINAADKWGVPLQEITTNSGVLLHEPTNRLMSYGEVARFGKMPDVLPGIKQSDLKQPGDFRLIGKVRTRRDVPAKTDGSLRYSIDTDLPGMVHSAVIRPPMPGARLKSVDENSARDVAGVIDILQHEQQVAAVAENYFAALTARNRIKVAWESPERAGNYDSDAAIEVNSRAARDLSSAGFPWDSSGDIDSVFAQSVAALECEYRTDYMYHAGIEPLNAVVWVKDNGVRAEVWAGTQAPAYTIDTVAKSAGIDPENVKLHRSLLGGGFGRRSIYGMDFVEDAAWISRRFDRPVKVIWERSDDIRNGYFRPMTAQFLRAALDEQANIQGWHHRVACEDPLKRFEPLLYEGWHGIPLIAMSGAEHQGMDGKPLAYAYDLPNRLVEYVEVDAEVRIYAMRGVGSLPNCFGIESFIDELAGLKQLDPLEYRLRHLHRSERAKAVLNTAADMAGWGNPRNGRGLGLAYTHHSDSMVACAVSLSVDRSTGVIKIHDVWVAADVGIAIQPDNVVAQLEGGVVFGLSNALTERIRIINGIAQQTNFHDYRVMRMSEVPRIHVQVIGSEAPPMGVGETGTIVAAAAVANAFADLTGTRLRHMPFTSERVMAALT